MKSEIAKTCIICQGIFYPDRRVEKRQKVCDKLSCKLERKSQSQRNWLTHNPDYFKGRYCQLKDQILKNKKNKTFQVKAPPSLGIQDELTSYNNNLLTLLHTIRSIQDEITDKITKTKLHIKKSINIVYKTN
jgi:hypothetical protein